MLGFVCLGYMFKVWTLVIAQRASYPLSLVQRASCCGLSDLHNLLLVQGVFGVLRCYSYITVNETNEVFIPTHRDCFDHENRNAYPSNHNALVPDALAPQLQVRQTWYGGTGLEVSDNTQNCATGAVALAQNHSAEKIDRCKFLAQSI